MHITHKAGLYSDGFTILTGDLENIPDFTDFIEHDGIIYEREFGQNGTDPGFLQDTTWSPNDSGVITLDLSALPLIEGGTINFIPYLNLYRFLHAEINDETGVDYMLLTIETADDNDSGDDGGGGGGCFITVLNR